MLATIKLVPNTVIGGNFIGGETERLVGGYSLKKELGTGAFGSVSLGIKDGKEFAVKAYNLSSDHFKTHFAYLINQVCAEVEVLKQMQHQNIIGIKESFRTNKNIYLVLDYYKDGDMLEFIRKNGFLSEAKVMEFLPQAVNALKYARRLRVVHRDIKLENFLLDGNRLALCDFGLAKFLSQNVTATSLGTASMKAPEIDRCEGYGFEVDVWALGVTFYMSIFESDPWGNFKYKKNPSTGKYQLKKVGYNPTHPGNCGSGLPFPSQPKISDGLKSIFQAMIQYDPKGRITLDGLAGLLSSNQAITKVQVTFFMGTTSPINAQKPNYGTESLEESIIERRETFDPQSKLKNLSESSEIIANFRFNQNGPKSSIADFLLSYQVNPAAPALTTTHQTIQNLKAQEAEEAFVEQFLVFNLSICDYFFEICHKIETGLQKNNIFINTRGVLAMASNLISKKIVQIAHYFISKLSQDKIAFTQIGNKYEFYQNGFAKQYLQRFEEILIEAVMVNSLSEQEAKAFLPMSYYRRDFQLKLVSESNNFAAIEEEALMVAVFYLFIAIEKYSSQVSKAEFDEAKQLIVSLKALWCYKDVIIFKAEADQYEELTKTLSSLMNPSKLDSQYQADKEYFRKWKDSLKTN